jgi:hypothetical protein
MKNSVDINDFFCNKMIRKLHEILYGRIYWQLNEHLLPEAKWSSYGQMWFRLSEQMKQLKYK